MTTADWQIIKFQFVDSVDKFPMAGKGNFNIHNVHSCHVETVCCMYHQKEMIIDDISRLMELLRKEQGE